MPCAPVLAILALLRFASAQNVQQVVAGWTHTCAILTGGTLKCFGYGDYGQLGSGVEWETQDLKIYEVDLGTGKTAKQVSVGERHTCALLSDNSVKCFGDRERICGIPKSDDYSAQTIGNGPGEMGDNLPAVDLGTGKTAKQISAGRVDTCFVLNDGSLKCCSGQNVFSINLGPGKTAKQVAVSDHICVILNDNSLGCFGAGTYGQLGSGSEDSSFGFSDDFSIADSLVDLGPGKTAKQVSVGERHTCAILNDDSLKCWGDGQFGQLGVVAGEWPDTYRIGNAPGEMGDNLTAVDLGTGKIAKQIAVGSSHTCVILTYGSLKCFGDGQYGQLGNRDITGIGPDDMGDKLEEVDLGDGKTAKQVSAGAGYTCVVLNDDSLKCFGSGTYGKLGSGTEDRILDAGDKLNPVNLGSISSASSPLWSPVTLAFAVCSLLWLGEQ